MAGVHTSCSPTPTKPDYKDTFPEVFFTGGFVLHKTHTNDLLYPEAQPKAVLGRMAHCMFICRRGHTTHIYSQVVMWMTTWIHQRSDPLQHCSSQQDHDELRPTLLQAPLRHVNFIMKPTKFGSNKEKLHSYIRTLEYICMWEDIIWDCSQMDV